MRVTWHQLEGHRVVEVTRPEDDPGARLPTVLSLHGRADRPHVPASPFYGIPGAFRYLAPEAPTPLGDGFSWFPVRTADDREDALAASLRIEVDRLVATLDVLSRSRPTMGELVVTGFSQGAILALGLAVRHPSRVSTALPSAGWLPRPLVDEIDPGRLPPMRALHGEEDEAVPVERARALATSLRARGADFTLRTYPGVGHTMSATMHSQKARWLADAVDRARASRPRRA